MLAVLQKGNCCCAPLGTSAPIVGTSAGSGPYFNTTAAGGAGTHTFLGNNAESLNQSAIPATADLWKWGTTVGDVGLTADLSAATSASINTLRQSITLQQFLENDARGGTRYTEIVRSRWGVISPDARLQRTEILGLHSIQFRFILWRIRLRLRLPPRRPAPWARLVRVLILRMVSPSRLRSMVLLSV